MLRLIVTLFLAALGLYLVYRGQRSAFCTQYLFFLRYPLLFAFALFFGPLCVETNEMVGNLFVLEPHGAAVVMVLGCAVASATLYALDLVLTFTRTRMRLPLFRDALESPDLHDAGQEKLSQQLDRFHGLITVILTTPLAVVVIWRAEDRLANACFAAAGVAFAGFARFFANKSFVKSSLMTRLEKLVQQLYAWRAKKHAPSSAKAQGFLDERGALAARHARALVLIVLSVALYVLSYFPLHASVNGNGKLVAALPALTYLLALSLVLVLLATGFAFYFDKYRIPALLPLLLFTVVSYSLFARDHVFPLTSSAKAAVNATAVAPKSATDPRCDLSPEKAVRAWHDAQPRQKKPTLVLVAASGGGITAALWTAKVLTELSAKEAGIGEDFARSIALISSASGGGVGAAYFVDAYKPGPKPFLTQAVRKRIVTSAGTSSLNETAFAMAYGDLFGLLFPLALSSPTEDRGWALERVWSRHLERPNVTLNDWRADIARGVRPTQIFNATIAETGERLLLTPIDCPTAFCARADARWRARSFIDLEAEGELAVVTAARLSATFPYVTPLSRQPGDSGYHIADGGYYDNFGVTTALEWLSRVHANLTLSEMVEKVILVEVRAAPVVVAEPKKNSGWLYATLGPAITMLNVRSTSQRDHNEAAIAALKALLDHPSQGVRFERVAFELGFDSPLSWQLSTAERRDILDLWDEQAELGPERREIAAAREVVLTARNKLRCLWEKSPDEWPARCGTVPPADLNLKSAAANVFEEAREAAAAAPATVSPAKK